MSCQDAAVITTPVPAQQPRPSRALFYVVGGAGLVVGALIVGVLWLTLGAGGGFDGDSAAVTAPAKVGDYQRFADLPMSQRDPGKATADRYAAWNKQTAQSLSAAYDGAAATVESYASDDLRVIFTMHVVHATAPGLYVPYQDPKVLGLKTPDQYVQTFGAVQCIVHVQPAPIESDSEPKVVATDCQRTGGGLTVRIPTTGGDLGEHPDQVAALVDQAFAAVG